MEENFKGCETQLPTQSCGLGLKRVPLLLNMQPLIFYLGDCLPAPLLLLLVL